VNSAIVLIQFYASRGRVFESGEDGRNEEKGGRNRAVGQFDVVRRRFR
jgi:hypothetical protein